MWTERIPSEDRKDGHLEAREAYEETTSINSSLGLLPSRTVTNKFLLFKGKQKTGIYYLIAYKKHLLNKVSASSL